MKAVPLTSLWNYRLYRRIDLKKDGRLALWLNLAALIPLIPFGILYLVLLQVSPVPLFLDIDEAGVSLTKAILPMVCLLPLYGIVIFSHELIHGIFFKRYSPGKIKYGFTGIFAYAGNPGMAYPKREYTIIGLAPTVILTAVLAVICLFTSSGWFFVLYWTMVMHLGGCAGDIYVAWILRRLPEETRVEDTGLCMSIYLPEEA
ncbi:MAG: DUF3267 domain-containing protein [Oscillospiraceae bacterium]|nr:DUF3267 domain-containing protein [Oscillospiraceae bacterium]